MLNALALQQNARFAILILNPKFATQQGGCNPNRIHHSGWFIHPCQCIYRYNIDKFVAFQSCHFARRLFGRLLCWRGCDVTRLETVRAIRTNGAPGTPHPSDSHCLFSQHGSAMIWYKMCFTINWVRLERIKHAMNLMFVTQPFGRYVRSTWGAVLQAELCAHIFCKWPRNNPFLSAKHMDCSLCTPGYPKIVDLVGEQWVTPESP